MLFGYTSKGYLNKFNAVNDIYSTEAHFGYDDHNKLIAGLMDDFEMEFVYQGAKLHRVKFSSVTDDSFEGDHYMEFTYTNGRVSKAVTFVKVDNDDYVPEIKYTYEYYTNGDLKTERSYYLVALPDEYAQSERVEYEYDNQINALQMVDEIAYVLHLYKSTHNIKKITRYDAGNHLEETISYSFNYNGFGLPTTGVENITYPNSPVINRNVTYSYQ